MVRLRDGETLTVSPSLSLTISPSALPGFTEYSRIKIEHRPKLERFDLAADLVGVPDHDDLHLARIEMSLGGSQDRGGGDGADARAIGIEIIRRQAVDDLAGERRGYGGSRLVANREDAVEIADGERELVGAHGLGAHAIDLMKGLAHRIGGDAGPHRGGDDERTAVASPVEARRRAIGVRVLLAEIQIDPRVEKAAEQGVHDDDVEVVGVRTGNAHLPHP